jgi:GTP pyrophosphokinase
MAQEGEAPAPFDGPRALRSVILAAERRRRNLDEIAIYDAYALAESGHAGQVRTSGEAYISHPVAVAEIVADLGMDEDSVIAALLHDVLEDTEITPEQVEARFGADVRRMVEGVTKLKLQPSGSQTDRARRAAETARAAESLRKMLLAMANDVRVMVIKLADRLHNMRTLSALPADRQIRIANETLQIYAPLAARLGIYQVKWQLEDHAFKTLHPEEFRRLVELLAKSKAQREAEVQRAISMIELRLAEEGIQGVSLAGRSKHVFSIWNKMVRQGLAFDEILDLNAIRVITQSKDQCYAVLGIVHDFWLPIPDQFFDYIGGPKPNGYQSIHTKVNGPGGPLEVQIRTQAMHEVAELGVAAHWAYKEGRRADDVKALGGLRRQLFDFSTDAPHSSDFLRAVSTDLFSEQVFVFTPKGDVLDLPADSTPLDFAFRVHTDLGLRSVGAKVNGVQAPLSHRLKNGDVVEMTTRSNAQPSLDWLELVRSSHARSKIRAYLRKRHQGESARRGKEAVERELKARGLDPQHYLSPETVALAAEKMRNVLRPEDVFTRVGDGRTSAQYVADRIRLLVDPAPAAGKALEAKPQKALRQTAPIEGIETRRAKCCGPIPGDEVVGYVSRGRGMVLHRSICQNLARLTAEEPGRAHHVDWKSKPGEQYPVSFRMTTLDRDGLLLDVSQVLRDHGCAVQKANIATDRNGTASLSLTILVSDLSHYRRVVAAISRFADVISVLRQGVQSGR